MLRKQGFEEKDIIKETEKIAPFVKHIHLSDNFGFEHTELPMGMGNVPLKEMMEKLPEKDVKKIIEAGAWWQHFQTSPLKESMEAMGAPMYTTEAGPFWGQTLGLQQGYFSGYGMMLPPQNLQTWGSGFSMASLPTELGGQMPGGAGSRMRNDGSYLKEEKGCWIIVVIFFGIVLVCHILVFIFLPDLFFSIILIFFL